jgi:hypothetical protein
MSELAEGREEMTKKQQARTARYCQPGAGVVCRELFAKRKERKAMQTNVGQIVVGDGDGDAAGVVKERQYTMMRMRRGMTMSAAKSQNKPGLTTVVRSTARSGSRQRGVTKERMDSSQDAVATARRWRIGMSLDEKAAAAFLA